MPSRQALLELTPEQALSRLHRDRTLHRIFAVAIVAVVAGSLGIATYLVYNDDATLHENDVLLR